MKTPRISTKERAWLDERVPLDATRRDVLILHAVLAFIDGRNRYAKMASRSTLRECALFLIAEHKKLFAAENAMRTAPPKRERQ